MSDGGPPPDREGLRPDWSDRHPRVMRGLAFFDSMPAPIRARMREFPSYEIEPVLCELARQIGWRATEQYLENLVAEFLRAFPDHRPAPEHLPTPAESRATRRLIRGPGRHA